MTGSRRQSETSIETPSPVEEFKDAFRPSPPLRGLLDSVQAFRKDLEHKSMKASSRRDDSLIPLSREHQY
ncbi:MAG: hypothetical protein DMF61_18685 [Blastocatellia bacterium AA13]|nr:MAG: hypothetical protein DMF61_18685 [Blastocatellia bacterium AA13]